MSPYFDIDPEDYTGVTTVITFAAGVTKQNVSVQTIDDSSSEGAESFTATLSNASPSDVVAITQPQATVNIADNDGKHWSSVYLHEEIGGCGPSKSGCGHRWSL